MSIDHTARIMEGYWSGHNPEAVATDAVFTDVATGQSWEGREAISGMLRFMYQEAFKAEFIPERTHISEGTAAVEGRFRGTHTGEFAGIEGTGKSVDVPLAVFYTVEDGGITEGRVWFMLTSFMQQISYSPISALMGGRTMHASGMFDCGLPATGRDQDLGEAGKR